MVMWLMIYLMIYDIFENIPSVPIILYKIEIQDNSDGHFSIEDFDEPVVIQPFPAAKSTLFRLKFNSCSYDDVNGVKDMFKTNLEIYVPIANLGARVSAWEFLAINSGK